MHTTRDLLIARRLSNLGASLLLIAGILAFYALVPYYRSYFAVRPPWLGDWMSWWDVLLLAAAVYVCLLTFYYLFEPTKKKDRKRTPTKLRAAPAASS